MNTPTTREALADFWQQHVTGWQASGMSQAEFCKQHDLLYHRFIYWKQKFSGDRLRTSQNPLPGGFVKVVAVNGDSGLSVTLPNGLVIRGLKEANLALVCRLADQLS